MQSCYINAALEWAQIEWLEQDRFYHGSIPELPDVWATGVTEDECRTELQEVLEDWLALDLLLGQDVECPTQNAYSLVILTGVRR